MTSNLQKPKIVVVCGPTGIGKTSVGIALAEMFPAEIVSADSMQIYRQMDIGTAKPTPDETARAPHHMIDIVDPDEPFDAARYSKAAREVVSHLDARGILPLVVGGTGLYIKSLVHGLFDVVPVDEAIRQKLKKQAEIHGIGYLHQRLSACDPKTAERLHPNDTYRILRALEIFEVTGESISARHRSHGFKDNPFSVLKIGLAIERKRLYDRIDRRVAQMIEAGLSAEVKGLLDKGYSPDLKSMQSIGYRHMVDYHMGRVDWDETVRTLKRDTRRYAKRQITWFRSDPEMVWAPPRPIKDIQDRIERFLQSGECRR